MGYLLVRAGDLLAEETGWGHFFIGSLFVAAITSLPESVVGVSAIRLDTPELTLGDLLGSNMANMAAFGLLAFLVRSTVPKGGLAVQQVFIAGLAMVMTLVALTAMGVGDQAVGFFSIGSLALIAIYLVGLRLFSTKRPKENTPAAQARRSVSRGTWVRFAVAATGVLIFAPVLAWSAGEIVSITGLEASFVGIVLLAAVTSFPELATTFAAVRQRAVGIAVGNLFGSNAFNMLILGMLDVVNGKGPLMNVGNEVHVVTGALSLVMMLLALAWVFTPSQRRWPPRRTSGVLLITIYVGGLYLVFQVAQGL